MRPGQGLLAPLLVCAAIWFGIASSAESAVSVALAPKAKLADEGVVVARLTITCDPGREILEAHLTVSQDDQRVSGTAGIAGVRCDGKAHKYRVMVHPQEGTFHAGEGFASAFVLVLDPATGTIEQGQASGNISLK